MAPSNPVIIVPGITATYLRDEYPISPEIVWSVMSKSFERVLLHPDDLRYEMIEPARIAPDHIFEIAYREIIEELRDNLSDDEDHPVPVFPFSYDWRHPLVASQAQLGSFIQEVIARTKLIKHYHDAGYGDDPKVNLIGHSMGGLVITEYLHHAGAQAKVEKVATIAAPFQGSLEAPLKITTGLAELGTGGASSRERHTSRLTPALYHLLPDFEGAIQADEGIPESLFDAASWQPSVLRTLTRFIATRGLDPENPAEQAHRLFLNMLGVARAHRERINAFTLQDAGLGENDWLCIVGVDCDTRVRLRIAMENETVTFKINSDDRLNGWSEEAAADRILTGDGTVPYLGALSSFMPIEKVVCVTPADYGYWEIQDRALTKLSGFHGIMPNMNMLHRLIARHFTGRDDPHGNTWGRRPPNIPEGRDWNPPLALREKT